jgi:serine protease Do
VQLDFNSPAATIGRIMEGLGAEQAGLKPGDHILAVNDQPVNEGQELIKTLRNFREGQLVKLRVQREEKEFEASVKMMVARPERAGRGFDRADRMNRMGGKPSQRAEGFALAIQHDTVLQAWQCGGPLVNLEGKAIGLNIARAGRVASYALPAHLVTQSILRLGRESRRNQRTESLETSQPVATPAH